MQGIDSTFAVMNHHSRWCCCFSLLMTILTISSFCLGLVSATQNITATKFLIDSETIVSGSATFKIGFFSPGNSTNRYVGIWYSDGPEVVWVANRDNPLHDTSGVLKISDDGNLQVCDGQNNVFWSSNASHQGNSSVAQLLDTGNLVLLSSASGTIIWQSFDHPTDSWLPQVSFTVKEDTNEKPVLRSWKGPMDPSIGRFSFGILPRNLPEFFTLDGDKPYWRSGPWNGYLYIGVPFMNSEASTGFNIIDNHDGTLYVAYSVLDRSSLERFELSYDGRVLQKFWNQNDGGKWGIKWQSIESECGVYGTCGPFGSCNPNTSPICTCLQGFEPKNTVEWSQGNWTSGCVRRMTLQCNTGTRGGKADKFLRLKHMKVPDYAHWLSTAGHDDCGKKCLANCLCLAYAYYSGIGCMIWNGSLIDIQQFAGDGADLFIRLAHLELIGKTNKRKRIIAVAVITATTTFGAFVYYLCRCISVAGRKATNSREDQVEFEDLPMFKFGKLEVATSNFSEDKKLGEGGFGTVYKGELEGGQQIAVKRLSRASGQGRQEFMNEVIVISKLQHRNLVKLLGCCVSGEEKLLVYEIMPNKSLDALLFDASNREHLDWEKRFNIIKGISRGLLYLHRDSRLRIIHRDLKPSNILLDQELNPKISDFGMARIFGTKQHQANTSRVVGTYGYMSPEYAMEGRFSEKSDIYSFGVLLLELVSGKRNSSFFDDESWSLLTHAWKLWNENNMLSLIDRTIFYPEFQEHILLCIQLGLLCVQEFPEDRPSISTFITMLDNNDVIDLPHPKQPGFTQRKICSTDEISGNDRDCCSINYSSLSMISGR